MSAAPPPFTPSAPRRTTNVWLWVILSVAGLCCLLLILAGVGGAFFVKKFGKEVGGMAGCMMNYEFARRAIDDYAADHQGKLPNAVTWQTDIGPYYSRIYAREIKDLKGVPLKEMKPSEPGEPFTCIWGGDAKTGIAFNDEISGAKVADIKAPTATPLLFEVEQPTLNAHEPFQQRSSSTAPKVMGQPRDWIVMMVSEHDIKSIQPKGRASRFGGN